MSVAVVLQSTTDPRWFQLAVERWQELLLDHANCEKKAASTALALMFSYPEDFELADRMSRLAREELRHFELVQQQLTALQVPFRRLSPSRYAEGLRKALRRTESERRMDLLLIGALIEARSHERFIGLIPLLGEPLGPFYASLAAAEARHAGLYLRLADKRGDGARERLQQLAAVEAELAVAPDAEFRFHSGTPEGGREEGGREEGGKGGRGEGEEGEEGQEGRKDRKGGRTGRGEEVPSALPDLPPFLSFLPFLTFPVSAAPRHHRATRARCLACASRPARCGGPACRPRRANESLGDGYAHAPAC